MDFEWVTCLCNQSDVHITIINFFLNGKYYSREYMQLRTKNSRKKEKNKYNKMLHVYGTPIHQKPAQKPTIASYGEGEIYLHEASIPPPHSRTAQKLHQTARNQSNAPAQPGTIQTAAENNNRQPKKTEANNRQHCCHTSGRKHLPTAATPTSCHPCRDTISGSSSTH